MVHYLISFPAPNLARVASFEEMASAEAAAGRIDAGAIYIFGSLKDSSLGLLRKSQLELVVSSLSGEDVSFSSKVEAIQATRPIIKKFALQGEENLMATTTKGTSTKSAAKGAKSADTPSAGTGTKRGRTSALAGKKLYKTEAGLAAKRHAGSRRTAGWALITKGMKYETSLERGVRKGDLDIMVGLGHIEAR